MELPIRIMITLFVALAVGSMIIVFSQQMISKSRDDIDRNRPGMNIAQEDEQKIIELNTIDRIQMADLMTECYNRNHGQTFERQLCFAVIAKSGDWTWNDVSSRFDSGEGIRANATKTDDVNDNDFAFSIYFDPFGKTESIEITR